MSYEDSQSSRDLLIVGASSFAEIAELYFRRDSEYVPRAFVVDEEFRTAESYCGLPVLTVNEALEQFEPARTSFFAALVYSELNRTRTRFFQEFKEMGYAPASFVSDHAYVDDSVVLGDHVFIFEHNTLQPFVTIGDNVILWSGNHIGHHSSISANCFISSHVVLSGHCHVGENSFIGVNVAIGNNVSIGRDNWIMPSVSILKDMEDGRVVRGPAPEVLPRSSHELFLRRRR